MPTSMVLSTFCTIDTQKIHLNISEKLPSLHEVISVLFDLIQLRSWCNIPSWDNAYGENDTSHRDAKLCCLN